MTWQIVRRLILPLLLVTGGIVALVFGAKHHAVDLSQSETVEQETEVMVPVTIKVLVPSGAGEPFMPGAIAPPGAAPGPGEEGHAANASPPSGDAPDGAADSPPPGWRFITEKVQKRTIVKVPVPVTTINKVLEPTLIFEATVGGVVFRSGELWRPSLAPGEEPPSLCPT